MKDFLQGVGILFLMLAYVVGMIMLLIPLVRYAILFWAHIFGWWSP